MLDLHGADDTIDLFDLEPVGAPGPAVVARADFRRIGTGPLPSGGSPYLRCGDISRYEMKANNAYEPNPLCGSP